MDPVSLPSAEEADTLWKGLTGEAAEGENGDIVAAPGPLDGINFDQQLVQPQLINALPGPSANLGDAVINSNTGHSIEMEFHGTPHKRHFGYFKELKEAPSSNNEPKHFELKAKAPIGLVIKSASQDKYLPEDLYLNLTYHKDTYAHKMIPLCEKHQDCPSIMDKGYPDDKSLLVVAQENRIRIHVGQKKHQITVSIQFHCNSSDGVGSNHDLRLWKLTLTDPRRRDHVLSKIVIKVRAEIKFPELGGSGRKRPMTKKASESEDAEPIKIKRSCSPDELDDPYYSQYIEILVKSGAKEAYKFIRDLPPKENKPVYA